MNALLAAAVLAASLVGHPVGAVAVDSHGQPVVTQANVHQTICTKGYATSVRPSKDYTNALKRKMLTHGKLADFELDHLIALELGGAPRDLRNLWMEPIAAAHVKDGVENRLHSEVCAGTIMLKAAQRLVVAAA